MLPRRYVTEIGPATRYELLRLTVSVKKIWYFLLAIYKDVRRLDSEKGVSKHFENVSCQGRIHNLFQGRDARFWRFFNTHFFRLSYFKANCGIKTALGGPKHALPKSFWKFAYCNGYCSAFWSILRHTLFNFFLLILMCFIKYDAFCSHISIYACLRRKSYCYWRGSKLQKKMYLLKTWLKIDGGGMYPILDPPLIIAIITRRHFFSKARENRSLSSNDSATWKYCEKTALYLVH